MATVYVEVVPTYFRQPWGIPGNPGFPSTWNAGDRVTFNNQIWVCITTHSSGSSSPGTRSTPVWVLAGSEEYPFQIADGKGNLNDSGTSQGELNLREGAISTDNFCVDAAGTDGTIIMEDGAYDMKTVGNSARLFLPNGLNLTAKNYLKARLSVEYTWSGAAGQTGTLTGIRYGAYYNNAPTFYFGISGLKWRNCLLEDYSIYGVAASTAATPIPPLFDFRGCVLSVQNIPLKYWALNNQAGSILENCTLVCGTFLLNYATLFVNPLSGDTTFRNTIFLVKDNTRPTGMAIFDNNQPTMTVENIAWYVEANSGGGASTFGFVGGTNILNVDPQFVDAANSNFNLRPGSPLIGASIPPPVPTGLVSYIAPIAQGAGTGTSAEDAWGFSDLANAEAQAGNGGTVIFTDGTYTCTATQRLGNDNSATAPGPVQITYESQNLHKAILSFPTSTPAQRQLYFCFNTFKKFLILECCHFLFYPGTGNAIFEDIKVESPTPFSIHNNPGFISTSNSPNRNMKWRSCSFNINPSASVLIPIDNRFFKTASSTVELENCTIYIEAVGAPNDAFKTEGSNLTFKGTILSSTNAAAFSANFNFASNATNCCIHNIDNNTSGGTNNIFVDPQFVGASTGNLKLRPTSPCIGASLGASAPSGAIYVFNGTQSGTADGSYGDPYDLDHIGDAETAAASGGIIIFKDGTYTLATHLDLSGSSTNLAITYRPETVGGVTITGPFGLRIGNAGLIKAVSFNDFIISIGDITKDDSYGLRVMNGAGGSISLKGVKGTIRIKEGVFSNAIGDNYHHGQSGVSFDCYLDECSFGIITDDIATDPEIDISMIGVGQSVATIVCNFTINNCTFYSPNASSTIGFCIYNQNGPSTGTVSVDRSIIYHDGLPSGIKRAASNKSVVTLSKCCYYKGWLNAGANPAIIIDSITVDPEFVDASSNNLSLRPTSPCIGAA